MRTIEVQGARMPALGFGTFQLTGAACRKAVATALGLGYRHVDTARNYGNEQEVGAGIRDSGVERGEIFLTTKIWMDDLRAERVRHCAEDSLRTLGTPYVDLLLIHWPNPAVPLGETLEAMARLQEEGKVRHLGVSNFPVALVEEAVDRCGARLLCDQVEYHALLSQRRLLDALARRDMILTAYCPLAKGRIAQVPVLAEIGRAHGKTAAQVALRWLVQQERVAAIPKTGSEARMQENLAVFDFELSAEDLARIEALGGKGRVISPAWAPDWDPA
jgi:2,5-diketo-D-gluconate reductase B